MVDVLSVDLVSALRTWRVCRAPTARSTSRCPEATVLATDLDYHHAISLPGAQVSVLKAAWNCGEPTREIDAAVEVQRLLAAELSADRAKRLLAQLEQRYAAMSGRGYAKYAAAAPRNPRLASVRTEIDLLLLNLRTHYILQRHRDDLLRRIRTQSILMLFVFLGSIGIAVEIQVYRADWASLANYWEVASFGAIGAIVSILRRANNLAAGQRTFDDPVLQASAMKSGYWGIWISQMLGPVFALTLLVLFMSGGLSFAGLTPSFVKAAPADAQFRMLDNFFRLATFTDAAKMVFWAFLAGFAETFVPDVLDRFSKAQ